MGTLSLRTSGDSSSGNSGSSGLYNDPGHSAAHSSSVGFGYNAPAAGALTAAVAPHPQIVDPRMKVHGEEVRGHDILGLHGREMRQAGRARFDQSSSLGTLGGGMGPPVYVPPSATGPGALGGLGFGADNDTMLGPVMRAPRRAPSGDVTDVTAALAKGKRANKKFLGL